MTRMTQRSSDREAIEAEIDRIRLIGLDDLRILWRTTFRSSPPKGFTKDLVARFICQCFLSMIDGSAVEQRRPPTLLPPMTEERSRGPHSSPIVGARVFFQYVRFDVGPR